jgi:hypothetical protein
MSSSSHSECSEASDSEASPSDSSDGSNLFSEYTVRNPPALNPATLQTLRTFGLAVIDYQHGIELHTAWDYPAVVRKLRELFPNLFEWFNGLFTEPNPDPDDKEHPWLPHFRLCNKAGKGVSVASGVFYPTGYDLYFNARIGRAGFRNHMLILS